MCMQVKRMPVEGGYCLDSLPVCAGGAVFLPVLRWCLFHRSFPCHRSGAMPISVDAGICCLSSGPLPVWVCAGVFGGGEVTVRDGVGDFGSPHPTIQRTINAAKLRTVISSLEACFNVRNLFLLRSRGERAIQVEIDAIGKELDGSVRE